ncbi:hypothetical protein A0H81_04148 [Grifola frondosa]|uniref:Uncharacterized protein n=1 Tax=Grifola frondosa TaxID=5627 RepID=A0A1C7MEG5_GRIFR|nr:hypothetical protein A0H81_04148 [Grifola frondosa]
MCEQELLSSEQGDVVLLDNDFWTILSALAQDTIVDVRIRVARLLAILSDRHGRINEATLSQTVELARSLAQDTSHEVQAFVRTALSDGARPIGVPSRTIKSAATFSRPPPPPLPSPG